MIILMDEIKKCVYLFYYSVWNKINMRLSCLLWLCTVREAASASLFVVSVIDDRNRGRQFWMIGHFILQVPKKAKPLDFGFWFWITLLFYAFHSRIPRVVSSLAESIDSSTWPANARVQKSFRYQCLVKNPHLTSQISFAIHSKCKDRIEFYFRIIYLFIWWTNCKT
jgi:hypothetical protein